MSGDRRTSGDAFDLSIPVIFGLATLVFFLMHLLPGDAVTVMLTSYGASGEEQPSSA